MRFPDGFLWGGATAAQIEGGNVHHDWWAAGYAADTALGRIARADELVGAHA